MTKHLSIEEQKYIYGLLLQNKLAGQIWPTFTWQNEEPIYGLLVGDDAAYRELLVVIDIPLTLGQFQGVLKRFGVRPFESRFIEPQQPAHIEEFYRKRQDRRIRDYPGGDRFQSSELVSEARLNSPVANLVPTEDFEDA